MNGIKKPYFPAGNENESSSRPINTVAVKSTPNKPMQILANIVITTILTIIADAHALTSTESCSRHSNMPLLRQPQCQYPRPVHLQFGRL